MNTDRIRITVAVFALCMPWSAAIEAAITRLEIDKVEPHFNNCVQQPNPNPQPLSWKSIVRNRDAGNSVFVTTPA
jgi:hypothetical protein